MVACCMPCTLNKPALRSSALNSFIMRLLFRVHAADSNEHHAVLSVASAMSKAATGSTHLFLSWPSRSVVAGRSVRVFTRSGLAPVVHTVQELFADDSEEKCYRQPAHQSAGECLKWSEQPPFFRQQEIAVTEGRVSHAGKIERRLGIRHTSLPPVKQRPDGDLNYVNDDKPPCNPNQQPCDWPEACIRPHPIVQHMAEHYSEPSCVNQNGDRNQTRGNQ